MKRITEADILAKYPSNSARRKGDPEWRTKNHIINAPNKPGHIYCSCMGCIMSLNRTGVAKCAHLDDFFMTHDRDSYVAINKACYDELKRALPEAPVKKLKDVQVKRSYGGI